MKRGLLSLSLAIVLTLGGCATIEQFQQRMDSYVGWDLDQLRAHFGYNYIERDLGDGSRAYTWVWMEHSIRPGYLTPDVVHTYRSDTGTRYVVSPGTYFPPEYYEYLCEFTFIVNDQNKAVSWRSHGNGCISYPGPEYVLQHQPGPVQELPSPP